MAKERKEKKSQGEVGTLCVSWYLTPKNTHIKSVSRAVDIEKYVRKERRKEEKKKKKEKKKKEKKRVTRKIGRFTPCANCISQMIACILHFCVITHSGLVSKSQFAVHGSRFAGL